MLRRNFFQRVYDSILRPQFAYDAVFSPKSGAVPYYFCLTGLLSLVMLLVFFLWAYPLGGVELLVQDLDAEIANFSLQDDHLTIDSDEPFVFQSGAQILIADNDPTAAILDEYSSYAGQVLYFGPDSVITISAGQKIPMPYEMLGWTFSKTDLLNIVSRYTWVFLLFIGVILFIGRVIGGFAYALIIAVLSLILNTIFKLNAPFSKLYALSLYALTGVFIVETVFSVVSWFSGAYVALPMFASYIVTLGFMGFYIFTAQKMSDGNA